MEHSGLSVPSPWPEPPLASAERLWAALRGMTWLGPVSPVSPPRCLVLECTHVCSIDYTVVLGLGELLQDFQKQDVALVFVGLQVGVHWAALGVSSCLRSFLCLPPVVNVTSLGCDTGRPFGQCWLCL